MAKRKTDPIDRLFSGRPGLSVCEKEFILDDLLDREAAQPRPCSDGRRWIWATAGCCGLVALLSIGILLFDPAQDASDPERDQFIARGQAQTAPLLRPFCHADDSPCRPGDRLVFQVRATEGYRHLSLFAARADGLKIWYFPTSEKESSIALPSVDTTELLKRAVLLGEEHRPGLYRINAIWSAEAIGREDARRLFRNRRSAGTAALFTEHSLQVVEP